MKVLVTGGAGYIGSTVVSALEDARHQAVILDSLVTGRKEFVSGKAFYQNDIADTAALERVFQEHPDIACTIHCAALIVVPESMSQPHEYYRENVAKSAELFATLARLGRKDVVFSSSASVYDKVPGFMVQEDSPVAPQSPYARTKLMMEWVLRDYCRAYGMRALALRYFNPIGADPALRSGIHVKEPSHVLGKLVDVALGRLPHFEITGVDWPTRDGSGIRDYIHVWDLAMAHVRAVERLAGHFQEKQSAGDAETYEVINLGTGNGVTVKELVASFQRVYGKQIQIREAPAREGDAAGAYANNGKARSILGWQPELPTDEALRDALRWGEMRHTKLRWD